MRKCGDCKRAAWVRKDVLDRFGETQRIWKVRCPGSRVLRDPTARACSELFEESSQLVLFGGAIDV